MLDSLSNVGANGLRTVTLKFNWYDLGDDQLLALKLGNNQQVDMTKLRSLEDANLGGGQITCFDGQTVHLAAGRLKSSIMSVVPVVGQNELSPIHETQVAQSEPNSQQPQRFPPASAAINPAGPVPATRISL